MRYCKRRYSIAFRSMPSLCLMIAGALPKSASAGVTLSRFSWYRDWLYFSTNASLCRSISPGGKNSPAARGSSASGANLRYCLASAGGTARRPSDPSAWRRDSQLVTWRSGPGRYRGPSAGFSAAHWYGRSLRAASVMSACREDPWSI